MVLEQGVKIEDDQRNPGPMHVALPFWDKSRQWDA